MFDLERSISEWRRQMLAAGIKTPVPLEELEIHLREEVERQIKLGLGEQKALKISIQQIGQPKALNSEFRKSERTFMKRSTEKAVLLTAACASVYIGAYVQLVKPLLMHEHLGFFQALFLLVYFFGVIPCLFLFRAPGWARAAIGAVAFSTALVLGWMTVRWLAVLLGHPGSEVMIVVFGLHLSSWEFFGLLALLALIVLGYFLGGLRILKIQA
jgi:hypothetical protein